MYCSTATIYRRIVRNCLAGMLQMFISKDLSNESPSEVSFAICTVLQDCQLAVFEERQYLGKFKAS